MSAFTKQEGGSHYKDFEIQPITFITKNNLNFFDGCIVKYACRHKHKGGALDLKKIIHYAMLELEAEYGVHAEIKYEDEKPTSKKATHKRKLQHKDKRIHRIRRTPRPSVESVSRKLKSNSISPIDHLSVKTPRIAGDRAIETRVENLPGRYDN